MLGCHPSVVRRGGRLKSGLGTPVECGDFFGIPGTPESTGLHTPASAVRFFVVAPTVWF